MRRLARIAGLLGAAAFCAAAAAGQQPPVKFYKQVTNVHLTLTATDAQGRPVTDLKPGDFMVLEDGQPQRLTEFRPAWSTTGGKLQLETGHAPAAGGEINPLTAPVYTAFAVDEMHLTMEGRNRAAQALERYSQHLRGHRMWALFVLRRQAHIRQFFTNDAAQFRQAAERILHDRLPFADQQDWNELLRELSECHRLDQETQGALENDATGGTVRGLGGGGGAPSQCGIASVDMYAAQASIKNQFAIDQLQTLIQFLGGLPGDKRLIYIGDGYSLNPGRMAAAAYSIYGLSQGNSNRLLTRAYGHANLRGLSTEAVRARVTLDVINARGLEAPYPGGNKPGRPQLPAQAVPASGHFQSANIGQMPVLTEELASARYLGMMSVAGATGGQAYWQSNDLGAEMRRAIGPRAGTYLAAYQPADTRLDGKYRRIKIRVLRRGVKIRTRRGYFAVARASLPITAAAEPRQQIQGQWFTPLIVSIRNRDLHWQRLKKQEYDPLILLVQVAKKGAKQALYRRLWLATLHPGPRGMTIFGTGLKLPPGEYRCTLQVSEASSGRRRTLVLPLAIAPQ